MHFTMGYTKNNKPDMKSKSKPNKYFSPAGSAYESRALPLFMEKEPYTVYEVLKLFKVKVGEICP